MKIKFLIIFLILNFYCKLSFAENIAVVNIKLLIDNNEYYLETIENLENSQQKYLQNFQDKENKLKNLFEDIQQSKLILNEDEINNKIDDYNKKYSNFSILVEEFNFHYQDQILLIREVVLKEIIVLLEKYATANRLDLILDSTSYLIASNSIDITDSINKELKKIKFKLNYEDFKNY